MNRSALILLSFIVNSIFISSQGLPNSTLPVSLESSRLKDSVSYVEINYSFARGRAGNLDRVKSRQDLYNLRNIQMYNSKGQCVQYNTEFSTAYNIHLESKIFYNKGLPDTSMVVFEQSEKMYRENVEVFDIDATVYYLDYSFNANRSCYNIKWDSNSHIIKEEKYFLNKQPSFIQSISISSDLQKHLLSLFNHVQYMQYLSNQLQIPPPEDIQNLLNILSKVDRVAYRYDEKGNWIHQYLIKKSGRVLFHSERFISYFNE